MAKQKVRLTHISHLKGAEGQPGDVVEVDEDRAEAWAASGGCVVLADDKPAKAAPKETGGAKDKDAK